MFFAGLALALAGAVFGLVAVIELTGRRRVRNSFAALTVADMFALIFLGFRTGSRWMVVAGAVVSVILIALGFLAQIAMPRERPTGAATLASSIGTFAASPGSRFLHLAVYRDGTIFTSRSGKGGKIPKVTRYALTGAQCPHCVIERQIQSILDEPTAAAALEAYRTGTGLNQTMGVVLSRLSDVSGWGVNVKAEVGPPNFDHACSVHQPL